MARNAYVYDLEGFSELLNELAEQTFIEEEGDIPALDPEEFEKMNKEFDKIKEKMTGYSTTRRKDFLEHKATIVPSIAEIFDFDEDVLNNVITYAATGEMLYCSKCGSTYIADDNCACYYHKEYMRENRKEINAMKRKHKKQEEKIKAIMEERKRELQREAQRELQMLQRMSESRREEYLAEKMKEMENSEPPTLITEEEYNEIFGDDD